MCRVFFTLLIGLLLTTGIPPLVGNTSFADRYQGPDTNVKPSIDCVRKRLILGHRVRPGDTKRKTIEFLFPPQKQLMTKQIDRNGDILTGIFSKEEIETALAILGGQFQEEVKRQLLNFKFKVIPDGTLIGTLSIHTGVDEDYMSVGFHCNANKDQLFAQLDRSSQAINGTSVAQAKIEELEAKLAKLQNEEGASGQISADAIEILISNATTVGPEGRIEGQVLAKGLIDKVSLDGQHLSLDADGKFVVKTYVPDGGLNVVLEAVDVAGVSTSVTVRLNRSVTQASALVFDRLNPITRSVVKNSNALALVIGISDYRETNAKAVYADGDARVFLDYAAEKLGVPRDRIKSLVNDQANEKEVLIAAKRWLARASSSGETDIYVFFAGHGLASDDGEKMYLLPYDGAPELLDKTAVLRDELFADLQAANPRSVTVFLDTCYSGTTRGPDMLIASRPIAIRAREQSIPEGFTVMTAAAGDQTAKPLEEAKHGMFSYFLMKGMEGDADANQDNQITAGELHAYVQQNVIQQSSGSQTPELQGDADRVLVRFQ